MTSPRFMLPLLLTAGALAQSTGPAPKTLQKADIATSVRVIKDNIVFGDDSYVVKDTQIFDGWFLNVDTLTFKSGAQLVFSGPALNARNSYFIVARRVVVEDPSRPGTITWAKDARASSPALSGQAGTGANGGDRDGSSGGKGADGFPGVTGERGSAAPNFTLFVLEAPAGGVTIDFAGAPGGRGGQGMTGGTGGKGGSGTPASQSAFDCKRGAGNGGSGGAGGIGGPGGPGGTGGTGGAVTIVTVPAMLPTMLQRFRIDVSGGPGGTGGAAGQGGLGGTGGPGANRALPYCTTDGSNGGTGPTGSAGPAGVNGTPGVAGDVFVGTLSQAEFDTYVIPK